VSLKRLIVYADGACWGNPGPAAIGAVIKDEKHNTLLEISEYIGKGTNNQAEYLAALTALEQATRFEVDEIALHLDSELVVRQLQGRYRVKNVALKPLYARISSLIKNFKRVSVVHIGHDDNHEAHKLAQSALKKHTA
jgi:ribonuclease HI